MFTRFTKHFFSKNNYTNTKFPETKQVGPSTVSIFVPRRLNSFCKQMGKKQCEEGYGVDRTDRRGHERPEHLATTPTSQADLWRTIATDCSSLKVTRTVSVNCVGRAPDCKSGGPWFNPTCRRFETWAISFTPHLPVSFGTYIKSRWSLLSGVYARGNKISRTGGKCVTCSGHTNSRTEQLLR